LEIENNHEVTWYNLGLELGKLGRYEEAIIAFRRAIEIKEDDANAWHNLGVAFYKLGKNEEAIKAFTKVKALDPTSPIDDIIGKII
jgi:tetratricopeptide (TPR) repeat protein